MTKLAIAQISSFVSNLRYVIRVGSLFQGTDTMITEQWGYIGGANITERMLKELGVQESLPYLDGWVDGVWGIIESPVRKRHNSPMLVVLNLLSCLTHGPLGGLNEILDM